MTLTYGLLALTLVIVALVLTALALLLIGTWARWLLAHGAAVARSGGRRGRATHLS